MKNLTKKEKILIMVLIVLIILIVSIITLKIIKTHDQKENTDFQIELDETIIKINEINKIYENIDLDDPTKYQLMEGITCYKYNGNDMQNVVEKINDLYINTIETSGMFNVVISEINNTKQEHLYVCKRDDCIVSSISDYELVYEDEERKIIRMENATYAMFKDKDNNWKFGTPVIICNAKGVKNEKEDN